MRTRESRPEDAAALCAILNKIVAIGGTTALEEPLSEAEFLTHFLTRPEIVCCVVAEDDAGALAGFQMLERKNGEPDHITYSSTFARQKPKTRGIGTAMFEATKRSATTKGVTEIIAKIRADNVSGLAYYSKMGFEDWKVDHGVPLKDGTPVDRISKRFVLG